MPCYRARRTPDRRKACRIPARKHVKLKPSVNTTLAATHRACEALPAPFAPECLHRLRACPNGLRALLALRRPQAHMARLAVRVPIVHRESNAEVRKVAVAGEGQLASAPLDRRRQKRVPTLGAKKVWLVIRSRAQLRIVERDEPLVDDRRLAVVAPRREILKRIDVRDHAARSERRMRRTS